MHWLYENKDIYRSGILFQPNITIFDINMKGKTCIHVHLKLSHF